LFGTEGFHGHHHCPITHTNTSKKIKSYSVEPKIAVGKNIKSLLLKGFELKPADDFLKAACLLMIVPLDSCSAKKSLTEYFYKMPMPMN
jgi:homogentisate 1,2-dioxygenase